MAFVSQPSSISLTTGYLVPQLIGGGTVAPELLTHALSPEQSPLSENDIYRLILNHTVRTDFSPSKPLSLFRPRGLGVSRAHADRLELVRANRASLEEAIRFLLVEKRTGGRLLKEACESGEDWLREFFFVGHYARMIRSIPQEVVGRIIDFLIAQETWRREIEPLAHQFGLTRQEIEALEGITLDGLLARIQGMTMKDIDRVWAARGAPVEIPFNDLIDALMKIHHPQKTQRFLEALSHSPAFYQIKKNSENIRRFFNFLNEARQEEGAQAPDPELLGALIEEWYRCWDHHARYGADHHRFNMVYAHRLASGALEYFRAWQGKDHRYTQQYTDRFERLEGEAREFRDRHA